MHTVSISYKDPLEVAVVSIRYNLLHNYIVIFIPSLSG